MRVLVSIQPFQGYTQSLALWARIFTGRCHRKAFKVYQKKLPCDSLRISDNQFIHLLRHIGKTSLKKKVIIPTGDLDALFLSKHKNELEQFYHIPIPEFALTNNMLNKKRFYKLLKNFSIDHPKTLIPHNHDELEFLMPKMSFPFIIKPSNSILFQDHFAKKCFIINSKEELRQAVRMLKGKDLDVMMQEIIPGNDICAVYMYFNKDSTPLAICEYDKLRHFPPVFGNGSFCKTAWRSGPINIAVELLSGIGYHGIAEPELTDPVE